MLRELLATVIHTLMGAGAHALCGAGYGQRSSERINQRNGYRRRQFDTRTGSLDLAIPKLRQGSYFPVPKPESSQGCRRTQRPNAWFTNTDVGGGNGNGRASSITRSALQEGFSRNLVALVWWHESNDLFARVDHQLLK